MAIVNRFDSAVAVEVDYPAPATPLRVWNGRGTLTYEAHSWVPGKLIDAGETSLELTQPRQSSSFELILTAPADRTFHFNEDRGAVPCRILWLWRLTPADEWKLAVEVGGRMADASYISGRMTVTVQEVVYDVDRGETLLMDNATQQRLHPGDLGFGYAAQIAARGGIQAQFPWPP